jgi:predicted Zn-dependent protease
MKYKIHLGYAIMAILVLVSCSRNPVTGKKEFMFMSESQEISLGAESDPQIIAAYGLYPDENIQKFITAKGEAMAAISHRPELEFKFRVLDSPVVNAFAVPGGYVYFTRGILAHMNNEAEFSGVLGHEIGHVTARHSAKQYTKQMLGQILFVGAMIASEDFRQFADAASQGLQLLFLKFGRDDESQSDLLGVEYSTEIGYDAHQMAEFFNTLKKMSEGSGQSIPTFMSTHPDPGQRNERVHELATEYQSKDAKTNYAINRESYLKMIDGIIYGEDPRQGFVENSMFYHPELKFQFPIPQGWQHQNTPTQFQMAPSDGKAMMTLTLAQGGTLDEAFQASVQADQLTVVESSSVRVNGLPAIAAIADYNPVDQNGQQAGESLRLLLYFIQHGGYIYKMYGISRQADFNTYFSSFQTTMKNFKNLTDPTKLNKQPNRIQIVTASRNGTLQNLLLQNGMMQDNLEELALINGMELTDNVTAGTMIKIVAVAQN